MKNTIAAIVLLVSACAGTMMSAGGREYQPQRVTIAADGERVLAAVVENAKSQGWAIESIDHASGVVSAVTPADDGMRQSWTFKVSGNDLVVEMRLELQEGNSWTSADVVCDSYGYHQEQAELAKVRSLVEHGTVARAQ